MTSIDGKEETFYYSLYLFIQSFLEGTLGWNQFWVQFQFFTNFKTLGRQMTTSLALGNLICNWI